MEGSHETLSADVEPSWGPWAGAGDSGSDEGQGRGIRAPMGQDHPPFQDEAPEPFEALCGSGSLRLPEPAPPTPCSYWKIGVSLMGGSAVAY